MFAGVARAAEMVELAVNTACIFFVSEYIYIPLTLSRCMTHFLRSPAIQPLFRKGYRGFIAHNTASLVGLGDLARKGRKRRPIGLGYRIKEIA